jgi:uncharacterized protein YbcI
MTTEYDQPEGASAPGEIQRDGRVDVLREVSRACVRIYKEQFGRGPEHVRSFWAGPDSIICFLENTLTPVEKTLGTMDEHQRLRDMRMLFQYAAEDEFKNAIEAITGRKVIGFVSGIDTKADLASEVFTLGPADS